MSNHIEPQKRQQKKNKADLYKISNPHKVQNQDQYDNNDYSFDALNFPNKTDKGKGWQRKGGAK